MAKRQIRKVKKAPTSINEEEAKVPEVIERPTDMIARIAENEGTSAAREARVIIAMELRIEGASYRKIASETGVSLQIAYGDVQKGMDTIVGYQRHLAERIRAVESMRMDRIWVGLLPEVDAGNPLAAGAAIKLMERRSKMFGLDAPARQKDPGRPAKDVTPENMLDRIEQLKNRIEKASAQQAKVGVPKAIEEGAK